MTLEVLTRHLLDRAALLLRQQRSLRALGPGWIQTLLVDPHRAGVPASHVRLRSVEPSGDFVWVLDDDDLCEDPDLLAHLRPGPDLYVVRAHYAEFDDVFPPEVHWRERCVKCGFVGPPNLIIGRDLWLATRHAWDASYDGDYDWVCEALDRAQRITWLDRVVATVEYAASRPPTTFLDPECQAR
jgi:hypothetical protein